MQDVRDRVILLRAKAAEELHSWAAAALAGSSLTPMGRCSAGVSPEQPTNLFKRAGAPLL